YEEMPLKEKLDWTSHRIDSIERLHDIDFASESAKKLCTEALAFQSEYFTRLLRQLKRSCATEEF
ncbi:MAG: hypothetical protein J6P94_06415, partial [Oscillospiraceae bacterium]|nr:hypothetical protein [Oscillospiraceae bacterium]